MGKAKNNTVKKYELTEREYDYIKALYTVLTYNIGREKLVSGFLYFIATHKLGYDESQNLKFEIDLDSDSKELTITEVK